VQIEKLFPIIKTLSDSFGFAGSSAPKHETDNIAKTAAIIFLFIFIFLLKFTRIKAPQA
jgi:hypothetical protein